VCDWFSAAEASYWDYHGKRARFWFISFWIGDLFWLLNIETNLYSIVAFLIDG
jgi:hypothetical protein